MLTLVLWVTIAFGSFQTAHAQQKPDWLQNHPADPLYYIGIDGVDKLEGDTDYIAQAREIALTALISQIEVNVSGRTVSMIKETNGEYEDFISSMVESQAQKTIEDYEIVDVWENDSEYWIYLRLSKQQYNLRLQEKIELAQKQAYTAFVEGQKLLQDQKYALALSMLIAGLGDVAPYIDRLSDIDHQGEQINLFAELRKNIQLILDELRITNSGGPERVRIGKKSDLPFMLKVVAKENEQPVEGLPIEFKFIRGDGEFSSPVYSDKEGIARGQLSKLTAQDKLQIVSARIDLAASLNEEQSSPFMEGILASLNSPTVRFPFTAEGVPAYLDYRESFLGENKTTNYMQPVLKSSFSSAGYTFIEEMNEAELLIELEVNTRNGSETYGLYSAFLDYKIQITSLLTGEEISHHSQADIKGISDSYQKAAAKAFETTLPFLQDEVLPNMITQIQK